MGCAGRYVRLPRGWVIPCEHSGHLWYLMIRRPDEDLEPAATDKYWTGKSGRLTMYGLDTILAYAHEVDRDSDPAEAYVDYSNGK